MAIAVRPSPVYREIRRERRERIFFLSSITCIWRSGSRISAEWAWVRGSYYDCKLRRVSTPVLVESDPGVPTEEKETLVSKTSNDVYRVVLGKVKVRTASNGQERELMANNEAVIALVINRSGAYAAIQSIKALRPAAAM